MASLRGTNPTTPPPTISSPLKLYEVRVPVRAYLHAEVERLKDEEPTAALEDCYLRSRAARRLRTLADQGVCGAVEVSPNHISGNYDEYRAKLTPAGAQLLAEVERRCIPDGRILKD